MSAVFVCSRKKVCSGNVALQNAHLRASACTDRLLSPCDHPPVSSLRPRICLVGRTMAPSQLQAAPTPRRFDRSKKKRPNKRAFWTLPFGTIWQSFLLCTRLPEGKQKNRGRTILWTVRSDRPDPVPGSFWQVCTHAIMYRAARNPF